MEASTSQLTWQDKFPASSAAPKPPPLPPPFGLPDREQTPLVPGAAKNDHSVVGSGQLNKPFIRPLGAFGVIGVLVLFFGGLWFGWASSTTRTESSTAIPATTTATIAATSVSDTVDATSVPEPQISSVATVSPVTEPTPVTSQVAPPVTLRPASKTDRGASVVKLSIPALPTSSNPATDAPAPEPLTMSPSTKPSAELVIPNGPVSPREACANSGSSGQAACLHQQCAKPALQQHPQCQRLRKEREIEFQRLYSGS